MLDRSTYIMPSSKTRTCTMQGVFSPTNNHRSLLFKQTVTYPIAALSAAAQKLYRNASNAGTQDFTRNTPHNVQKCALNARKPTPNRGTHFSFGRGGGGDGVK